MKQLQPARNCVLYSTSLNNQQLYKSTLKHRHRTVQTTPLYRAVNVSPVTGADASLIHCDAADDAGGERLRRCCTYRCFACRSLVAVTAYIRLHFEEALCLPVVSGSQRTAGCTKRF